MNRRTIEELARATCPVTSVAAIDSVSLINSILNKDLLDAGEAHHLVFMPDEDREALEAFVAAARKKRRR